MLDGIYGKTPVHSFLISGLRFYVIRGTKFIAALHGNVVCVFAPKGLSYHQAAAEANRAIKEGKAIPNNHLSHKKGELNDF